MESISNISSEEELLQLRNDGKVSETEYQDLLEVMRKTSLGGDGKLAPRIDKTKSKRKLGKTAFVLMLLGIILPTILFLTAGLALSIKFFLCLAFEIAALTMGIRSWVDDYGKTAAIASGIIIVIAILLII